MKTFVCIECPSGCTLTVEQKDGELSVAGNKCKKGAAFAKAEMTDPKRTICSTVKTVFPEAPVLPVRVSAEIPKAKIFDVMRAINGVTLDKRLKRGEAVIKDVLGLGVDIIVTSDIISERSYHNE